MGELNGETGSPAHEDSEELTLTECIAQKVMGEMVKLMETWSSGRHCEAQGDKVELRETL